MAELSGTGLAVLVASAFAFPLVFLAWIRNTERFGREPWRAVLKTFTWGAVISVIVAIVLSLLLLGAFEEIGPVYEFLSRRFGDPETALAVVAALVVAPLAEEAAKAVSVRTGRRHSETIVDGLVYGAAAGLGFSATENLFYGVAYLAQLGASGSILLIVFRSFSSSLLHASATAVTGYGMAKGWHTMRRWAFLPFYFVAVLMHATFNFLSTFGVLYSAQVGEAAYLIGFAATLVFAVTAVTIVRFKLARQRSPAGR